MIRFLYLYLLLFLFSNSYAHNRDQMKQMDAKKTVELKYNQEQFKIFQNKINELYEQQDQMRADLDKAKAQIQNNNLQISQAVENSNTLNDSIGEVERLLKKNEDQPISSSALGHEHIVESGHTLSVIAQAYGSTVEAIKRTNNLNNDVIYVGQKLFIPE